MTELTQARLKELLHYDADTGIFTWISQSKHSSYLIGKEAGYISKASRKYIGITINGVCKLLLAHRLAWLYMTGEFPKNMIDHIDGNPLNNKFDNLRNANRFENQHNQKLTQRNKSGLKGVSWHKISGKWTAQICHKNKKYYLGLFDDKNDAYQVRCQKAIELHKEFVNHG